MERETRVEKYRKLREEIAAMDNTSTDTPYTIDDLKVIDEKTMASTSTSTRSISLDDIFKAHDKYTATNDVKDDEQEEKEKMQALIAKKEKCSLIIWIGVFSVILITFIAFLIYFIIA